MSKTITIRLDESIYNMFKTAADGQHRSISNFIEWATLAYLSNETFVSDEEMDEINEQAASLRKGLSEAKQGKYTIVE